ncbi:cerevisin [Malassezia yamatoensis]|uniref:Cerevisin n=1 Tax=Malassezia yamatoensis TaxID=253288 RepID=A0AAJ5YUV8_9BASI|nr:cerevisin [Malassezia yamatoensis]
MMIVNKAGLVLLIACTLMAEVACAPLNAMKFVPGMLEYASITTDPVAPFVQHAGAETLPHQYLVALKPGVTTNHFVFHHERISEAQSESNVFHALENSAEHGVRHVYDLGQEVLGYAGSFSEDVLAYIRAQPEVEMVERDQVVRAAVLPQGNERVTEMRKASSPTMLGLPLPPWLNPYRHQTETNAPWGLARLSHRASLSLGTFNKYVYEAVSGEGVTAYVIDTGIYTQHEDFQGRARWGKTIPQNDVDADQHGHGTHCAGTIGSATYGVAKKAKLVAVKVLGSGGQGSMSDVTAGVLWAVADAQRLSAEYASHPHTLDAQKHRGFVASMSLGGSKSAILDRAVNGAVESGMHFAVAAGNENQDACNVSPASASAPITVGASTIADERAYFSNIGRCVDIFGPGLNVLSTWNTGKLALNTMSGTSMATPHIAGLMAYLLSIYGSGDFALLNSDQNAQHQALAMQAQNHAVRAWAVQSLSALHAFLPAMLRPAWDLWLPSVETMTATGRAPSSIQSTLTPKELRKALTKFASKDVLSKLDRETVNLLAYNNATTTQST